MIRFEVSSTSVTGNKVSFGVRPGNAIRGWKDQERDLLYGYRCQYCSNPILFAFLTEKKLNLGRFEETRVVNGERDCIEVIPHKDSQYSSAYETTFTEIPGKATGIEHVYMKNHVLSLSKVGNPDPFEPGARCCPYVGIFSHQKETLIRDAIVMGGFPKDELAGYNLPSWEKFTEMIEGDTDLWFAYGVNVAQNVPPRPPMVITRTDWIKEQKGGSHWRGRLLTYKKPAE